MSIRLLRSARLRNWSFGVSVVLCLVFVACLAPVVSAQSGAEIKRFNFIGNEAFSDKHLRNMIKKYHISRLSKLFSKKDPLVYDSEVVAEDTKFLVREYQREGFLAVEVATPRVDFDRLKDQAVITFSIAEGRAVNIKDIRYSVSGVGPQEEQRILGELSKLGDQWQLKTEDRFRDTALLVDQDTLRRKMSYLGYPYADPAYDLAIDTDNYLVDVNWQIKTGPVAKFDTAAIGGNNRVSEEMITGATAFDPGQLYDQRLVEQSQQQIYGLGMFQVVTAHPRLGDPPLSEVPVDINVREAPRYRVKFGVGYGREDKFRAFVDLYKYGFLGQIRQLRLYARHSDLEPYHVRLTFTQPSFIDPRTVLTITPFIRRQNEKAFRIRRIGSEAGLSHVFTRYFNGSANYIYEGVRLVGDSIPKNLLLGDSTLTSYLKSTIVLSGQFDNSAPLLTPTHGVFSQLNLTLSGLGLGSDFRFWKLMAEARKYQEVWKVVLAGRLKFGGIDQLGGNDFVPLEERMFSGGSNSVRGWARQELGPKIDGVPTGGNSLIEGSGEVRFPVYGMFSGAVFMDFGNVWLSSFTYHLGELRYAAGVGVRVSTPIGPVRLDVARPVFDEETTVQLHVNIGQAF